MRAPIRLGLLQAPLLFFCACSSAPQSGALRVVVSFGANSRAQCVKVSAANATGASKLSEAIPRAGKAQLKVGIERGAELTGQLTVQAHGFTGADCADATLNEESETAQADIGVNGVHEVNLTLDGPAAADDADGDHYAKGVDCDDANAAIHPGQQETDVYNGCADGKDDDCDGLIDCADSDCESQSCRSSTACTSGGTCTLGVCTSQQVGCTNPGTCETATGASCDGGCLYPAATGASCGDGGVCRSDKSCGPANGEVLCGDGIDNDSDGLTDCADPDCSAQACDGGTVVCTQGFTCQANACTGTSVTCTPPAGTCLSGGSCTEPGGCGGYTVGALGSDCGGGLSCVADGGCEPAETGAFCADGLDNDHDGLTDCADPGCNGQSCDDGNTCTALTTCSGGSCGGGNTTMCNSPPTCFATTTCQNGLGCVYPPTPGVPCGDGGTCLGDGGCGPSATTSFPYTPSNFDPSLFPNVDAGVNLNCNAVLDTSATNPFRTWCNTVPPYTVVAMPDGGGDALLVAASSFTLGVTNTLRVTGARPLILAVYGDATVSGTFIAQNVDGGTPPGGSDNDPNVAPFCSTGRGVTVGDGSQTNGGGGGGSFGTQGTDGSNGNQGGNNSGGAAGATNGADTLVPLRGGCPGGNGGTNATNGGWGGGAMQLSVAGKLQVSGHLGVPGGGGVRGVNPQNTCGGGGGGSGGALLLEATAVQFTLTAVVTANGGGGGEGANLGGNNGQSGEPGHYTDALRAAGGSFGTTVGGDGSSAATAYFAATAAQNAPSNGGCGGGGSGGMGIIRLNHYGGTCVADAGIFSPTMTLNTPCP